MAFNTARHFVEQRQVSWAILAGVLAWGTWAYFQMPQRKDPEIPVRETVAIAIWPGQPAERVEQLVTRKVEEAFSSNPHLTDLRSFTRQGVAYVFGTVDEKLDNTGRELDDLQQKLAGLVLPQGVLPVQLVKDFGDTSTLMLSVASPLADAADLELRARDLAALFHPGRTVLVWPHARSLDAGELESVTWKIATWLEAEGHLSAPRPVKGSGFTGFDAVTSETPETLCAEARRLFHERLQITELHPDVWEPAAWNDVRSIRSALESVAGPRYTYRQLDEFSDQIAKAVKTDDTVARVNRSGLLGEEIRLQYSQERWASYGLPMDALRQALASRSVAAMPGTIDAQGRSLPVVPQADFRSAADIGNLLVPSPEGAGVHLRDLVTIERGYQSPAPLLNYFQYRDRNGEWRRARAISLDIQMRGGEQISRFDRAVSQQIERIRRQLPPDLIVDRTSDQPRQVRESVGLFMWSLWEAIILVVVISLIGFWEWRSALVMALAIPVTLALTFGMVHLLGVDLQQVSIASLILALGLLVDDPVVASDAIQRELAAGSPPLLAAWMGPTKLAKVILYATVTNIVAYLPFLMMTGDNRRFLLALPIVVSCSLVASRLVSMTFIPLFAYYLLRGRKPEPGLEHRRRHGFGALYCRISYWSIRHRWAVAGIFTIALAVVGWMARDLKQQYFPFEREYLSFTDVWLPQNASLSATAEAARKAERVLQRVAAENHRELRSLTIWIGGGGPRYWFSSNPEPQQPNYAQILMQVRDKEDTGYLLPLWQRALSAEIPEATLDVRRLETSAPIGVPIQIRISGEDIGPLRAEARKLEDIFRSTPGSARVRNDWGEDIVTVDVKIDDDRAALAGISPAEAAAAATGGLDGIEVGSVRDGDREIPVVLRLRMEERARISDLSNLYVWADKGMARVRLSQIAAIRYHAGPGRIGRYQQFRTITVQAFPGEGLLASEVLAAAMPRIERFRDQLPAGLRMEIAGEYKEQAKGFGELSTVMSISVLAIYFALLIQFRHAVKPLIVFAAIPFGILGGLLGLELTGAPFGFMAFLGVASLIGVIVSHILVLFDFIEEQHLEGRPLEEALADAGILRLRPVLITVGATVIALVPLAAEGGPLWEPLCYVQIGGLLISTLVTLVLVPVLYAIFVKDLKWVKWAARQSSRPSRAARS